MSVSLVSLVPDFTDAVYQLALDNDVAPNIRDGYGVSDDPGDSLNVGIDAPMSTGPASSADSSQSWANANYTARDETGTLTCAAYSIDGGNSQKVARDAVFAIMRKLLVALYADPTLGIPNLLWSSLDSTDLSQDMTPEGAEALLVFRIGFRARLF